MRLRVHEARQGVRIGRFQLGELAPFENALRQLVALLGKVVERACRGRPGAGLGLGAARQAHLAEQDVAQLLGRAEVEALTGERVDLAFEPRHALREFPGKPRQDLRSMAMPRRSMRASTGTSGRSSVS